jgi:ring-1,2-phenylacetyl-CoA epoxidase subunit PaaC
MSLQAYVLGLGDDALVTAQRIGEWIARAPQLEEDVALGNIALDQIGQARSLLSYAGSLDDPPRTEDDVAYFRDERDFLNVQLVERANGDFATTIVRLLVFATYQCELYAALTGCPDETVAAVAAKAVKEVDYHRDHAAQWTLRLGDGTEESHGRMVAALEAEWPYVDELFAPWADALVAPESLRPAFDARVAGVLDEATLAVPDVAPAVTGGRRGIHTEQMGYLLAEMQHLARSHPGVTW